jgi:hypothetical protein
VFQYVLALPEPASERLERLLAQLCPVHIGTTLDGGNCAMCEVEAALPRSTGSTPVTRSTRVDEASVAQPSETRRTP